MLCWGIGPVFAKLGLRGVDPVAGLWARTMIAGVIVTGSAVASARVRHFSAISLGSLGLITLEAILATVVGDLAYYAAIKRGSCSQVSVILSASPAITIVLSAVLLSERPGILCLVGAGLVTLGLIFVSLPVAS
jgi:bacterial/archaeal transporter family protein